MSASQTLSLPDNPSLFTRLHVAYQCIEVLKVDQANPHCGQLLNICLDGKVYASLVQQLQRTVEGRRLLAQRPSLQARDVDLPALERLPEGTLGHSFARYYRDNKIAPFETTLQLKKDIDYIGKRYRETHDLLHVLTGYGTDMVGEMELQAYALGNLGIRTAAFILLYSSFDVLKGPQPGVGRSEYLRRVWAAFRRGRASPLFLDFWFEEHWETPVATLRARLCAPAQPMN